MRLEATSGDLGEEEEVSREVGVVGEVVVGVSFLGMNPGRTTSPELTPGTATRKQDPGEEAGASVDVKLIFTL